MLLKVVVAMTVTFDASVACVRVSSEQSDHQQGVLMVMSRRCDERKRRVRHFGFLSY